MPKLTAFIARSFSKEDEARLRPTLEFLESFRKFGFVCASAEPAEVESVSLKVRRIIDESDVLIGFFTKRHPIYGPIQNSGLRQLFKSPTPIAWSAPPWVLQESGYALAKNKKLILLREGGVDIPGLQGDLEYVPFFPERASDIFAKLSEMIHEVMAEAAGIKVEVVVSEQGQVEPPPQDKSPTLPEEPPAASEPDKPSILPSFFDMIDAAAESNFEDITSAYEQGKLLIEQKKVDTDPLVWECLFFEHRFKAGAADALDLLRSLQQQNPTRHEPLSYIADILQEANEHGDAAMLYQRAAELAKKPENRIALLIKSARAFNEATLVDRANEIAWQAYRESSSDEQRREAAATLYEMLKNKDEIILAFAVAEAALHDNPQHAIRFRLGLDYHSKDFDNLFLLHFKYLCAGKDTNAPALHNLALAFSECGLHISSVDAYKRAISLGETLAAANLAYKYLEAGMADNAREILKPARQVEGHESSVDKCYSEIDERIATEEQKEKKLLADAQNLRKFLNALGKSTLKAPPKITGKWKLPFGDIELNQTEMQVSGAAEITTEQTGVAGLLGAPGEKISKIEVYGFSGSLTGSACKFKLQVRTKPIGAYSFLGLVGGTKTREGFIIFDSDGNTGTYAELEENKLTAHKLIVRREAQLPASS